MGNMNITISRKMAVGLLVGLVVLPGSGKCGGVGVLGFAVNRGDREDGGVVVSVGDFGAVPDDGVCDAEAVGAALARVKEAGGGGTVKFSPGKYHFRAGLKAEQDMAHAGPRAPEIAWPCHLALVGLEDVTLEGAGGTTFVFTDETRFGIVMNACRGVTLRGFALDYETPPFSQGVVLAVDVEARTVDVRMDAGFPLPVAGTRFTELSERGNRHHLYFFTDRRELDPDVSPHLMYKGIEPLGGRDFRFVFRVEPGAWRGGHDNLTGVKVGAPVAVVTRGGAHTVLMNISDDTIFDGVVWLASPGFALLQRDGGRTTMNRCAIRRAGPDHLMSVNMDGLHFESLDHGPLVEHCDLRHAGDDLLVVLPRGAMVHASENPRLFLTHDIRFVQTWKPGDELLFYAPGEAERGGEFLGRAAIASISGDRRGVTFSLDRDVAGLVENAMAMNNRLTCPGFVLRDNVVGGNRGRGILVSGSDGVVENNRAEGCAIWGILAIAVPPYHLCTPENLVIRGNTVTDQPKTGAIGAYALNRPLGPVFRNFTIENNTISMASPNLPMIFLDQTAGARIANNTFLSVLPQSEAVEYLIPRFRKGLGKGGPLKFCIGVLDECEEISIENNLMAPEVRAAGFQMTNRLPANE
jgi:hypothetical protein